MVIDSRSYICVQMRKSASLLNSCPQRVKFLRVVDIIIYPNATATKLREIVIHCWGRACTKRTTIK